MDDHDTSNRGFSVEDRNGLATEDCLEQEVERFDLRRKHDGRKSRRRMIRQELHELTKPLVRISAVRSTRPS